MPDRVIFCSLLATLVTEIRVRALVLAPPSCGPLAQQLIRHCESAGVQTRVVDEAEQLLPLLEEYRFDVVVLLGGPAAPTGPAVMQSLPLHLQLPALTVFVGSEQEGGETAELRIQDEDEAPRLVAQIRTVVARARAALGGGTPEKTLADSVGAILWRADPVTFDFIYVSDEAEAILGYPVRDWLSDPNFWVELIHPDDREATVQTCVDATARGEDHEFEYRTVARDGRTVWIRDIVRLVDVDGRTELVGVMVDITEAKEIESALRESEKRFRQVTDTIEEVFWLRDRERAFYVSPAYEKIWGRPTEELYADASVWDASIHPDDRALLKPVLGRPPSSVRELTFRILRPDGEVRWIHNRSFPVRDENGNAYRMAGIARDISDLVAANEKLIEREAHYQRLVMNSPEMVCVLDLDGRIREINGSGACMVGRESGDMIGRSVFEFLGSESADEIREAFADMGRGTRDRHDADLRFHGPDGEVRWVRITFVAVHGDGDILGIQGIGRDVTEAVVRREQMDLLYSAMDSLDQGVSIVDMETAEPLYRNRAWARLLGCDPEKALEMDFRELLPDGEEERLPEIREALLAEGQWSGRIWRRRQSDGEIVALDTMHGKAPQNSGRTVVFSVMTDASLEIEREKMMMRAERLASLGTLVGGVAHELNNPLHAIRTFAELLLEDDRSPEDRAMLEMTRREADRAARVVADLRLFARRSQDESRTLGPVDLNETVRHVVNVRAYTLSTRNIEVVTDLGDIPPLIADEREIEQLLFNLFINAEQAVDEGRPGVRSRIRIQTSEEDGHIVFSIEDNGTGIARADVDLIFDPFFTTKAPGQGTGLGLSLVHRIVQEHDGDITVESEVGEGSVFTVRLPVPKEEGAEEPDETLASTSAPERELRVLVVDDEPAIRKVVAAYLKRRGHRVDTASDGGEALELIAAADYDALVSDLRMPGLDGAALLRNLRDQGDGLAERCLFLTGDPPEDPGVYGIPVLAKPAQMDRVADLVEKLGSVAPKLEMP